jgi:alpha-L-arabinofuranosidase
VLKATDAPFEYERLEFTLTPDADDGHGRFAITVDEPGTVTIGYAFLQPGSWGRFKGLPVRKDLVQALIDQGVKVVRFSGSMINPGEHEHPTRYCDYDWKHMIGPRDLRPTYQGTFNPYTGNGFGVIDFLNLCEAAGFLPIPGLNTAQSPQDLADFVEYVNGPANSIWGQRRVADGHPAPYGLRYVEFGNEEIVNEEYALLFKAAGKAVWSKDPNITMVVADWMYRARITDPNHVEGARCTNLSAHVDILNFAKQVGGKVCWDVHVLESSPQEVKSDLGGVPGILDLDISLTKMVPDFDLKIAVLEENAGNHDMARALGHALMKNTMERNGSFIPALAAPNTFQPWGQYTDRGWDQAQIFFTPAKVWFQPAYYVDQMITRNWEPNLVNTSVDGPAGALDVTAKKSDDERVLTLQVVNVKESDVSANINLVGFVPSKRTARIEEIKGDLGLANTPEHPTEIVSSTRRWKCSFANGAVWYTFPGHSFTVIRLE